MGVDVRLETLNDDLLNVHLEDGVRHATLAVLSLRGLDRALSHVGRCCEDDLKLTARVRVALRDK